MSPRRAFTLAETLVALGILAMIGAGVAGMLASTSAATEESADVRRVNVKEQVITGRLDAAIRSSSMVLAQRADALVLWTGDARANGRPDLSELRRIQWSAATEEIRSYRAPAGLSEARDASYRLSDDFDRITARLMGSRDFPGERWGTGVTGWSPALDTAFVQDATLVSYVLDLDTAAASGAVERAVAPRGRRP